MKSAPTIALCLTGMLAGLAVGRMIARPSATEATPAAGPASGSSKERSTTAKSGDAIERKHDLGSLMKWRAQQDISLSPEVQHELERMSAQALRDLIVEMTAVFSDSGNPDSQGARQVIAQASLELFRRDGEAALEWASTMNGDRELMMSWMLGEAAVHSPELAKRWIEQMSGAERFHKNWESSVVSRAIEGAKSRGAEDLIRLRESYGDLMNSAIFAPAPFPPGFDYQKLFTSVSGELRLPEMVQYWAATDREAAWASVKKKIDASGKGANYSNSLFTGVAAMGGGEEAAKWLIPKIEQLSESARLEAIDTLSRDRAISAEGVSFVMEELTRESDRVAMAKGLVSINTTTGQDLAALRGLSSDSERLMVLEIAAGQYVPALANAQPQQAKAVRDYFRKTMASLDMPKAAQESVMGMFDLRRSGRGGEHEILEELAPR